jgi:hypothetical protein
LRICAARFLSLDIQLNADQPKRHLAQRTLENLPRLPVHTAGEVIS